MRKFIVIFLLCCFAANATDAAPIREIRDTEIERVIDRLVRPIEAAADLSAGRLRVHIVSGNDINAFVVSGEDIFLHAGTIIHMENPNAVQAIIAHELGHVVGGHYANMAVKMENDMAATIIMQTLGIAAIAMNPEAGMGILGGLSGVAQQNFLSFSRDEERLADATALKLLKDAGLPVDGMVEMMQVLQSKSAPREARMNTNNTSHPATTERLMNVRGWIDKNGAGDAPAPAEDLVAEYQFARAKLAGYLLPARVVSDSWPLTLGAPAKYARTIAAFRADKLKDAVKAADELVQLDDENPWFLELRGDINSRRGDYAASIADYGKALDLLDAASPQISGALALALVENGDADDAVRQAKRAIFSGGDTTNPFLYFVLARAYSGQNQEGLSDWAMAEYHWRAGKKSDAVQFAKRARAALDKDSAEYKKVQDILNR